MVTREWLEVAVREAAMVDVVTIVKIDFEKVAKVNDSNEIIFSVTFYLKGQHRVAVTAKLGSLREQV